jgi:hypothetical protein
MKYFFIKINLFICLLFLSTLSNGQGFKAGAALRIITPNPLLPISGGVGIPNPSKEKQGDLFARAVVIEKGKTRIAIVSVDNLGWTSILGDRSRKLIKGIAAENILIGATHTHSAPDAYAFPDEKGNTGADFKYLDLCVQQIADAVNEAISKLEPATLKTNVEEAIGKIAYNYYADQLYDPRCGVIQAIASSGANIDKPIFTLVNYAVHPEVIGSGRGILSPDLCGPLYSRIEQKVGGMAIFMNGAQGGMVTADNRVKNGEEANNWNECKRIGELLADEALRIINKAKVQVDPSLFCTAKTIQFPITSPLMKYILENSKLKSDKAIGNTISTQQNLINIGTAQIVTIPGEALPNIGYYLKRKMHTKQAFLFGLTNDAFGYILTKEDFQSFKRYDYVSRTSLGEMTGDILVNETLKLVTESPAATDFK